MSTVTPPSRGWQPSVRILGTRWDWFLVVPLLVPLGLIAARNDAFMFDPPGWLDPFVYVGYFWHYPEHLRIFDNYYKISRLPWVLPGFVAHTLAGEIAGSYVLHWAALSGGASAMYVLVRDTLKSTTVAAAASVAWACCTWSHGIGGWNYHILAASAYYLWGCWFIARSASHSSRRSAVAAGVLLGAAVHAHLFFVVFAPLVMATYAAALPAWRPPQWARWARDVGWIASGGVCLTVVLSAINAATGGSWLFFMPQIEYTLWLSQPGNNHWWNGDAAAWLPSATYLVLPLLALLAAVLPIVRSGGGEIGRFRRSFALQLWAAFVILGYYTFVRRQTVLDNSYMAFPIYCPAIPALAAAIWRPELDRESMVRRVTLCAFIVMVIFGSLLVLLPTPFPEALRSATGSLPPIVGPLMVGGAGVVVSAVLRARAAIVAFALWFTIVNTWVAPSPGAYGTRTPAINRSMLTLFRDADRFTTALDPSLHGIRYWFGKEQVETVSGPVNMVSVFDSYVSTRGWLDNLFAQKSPGPPIPEITTADFKGATCLGLLSTVSAHPDLRARLLTRFAELNRPLVDVGSRRFEKPELGFALSVFRISPAAGSQEIPRPAQTPPCLP